MWKEVTREKPARRGWTVTTLALAFLGTVGLAKIMVDVRANDDEIISGRQSPADWPISFVLPAHHRWRAWGAPFDEVFAASSGGDVMSFLGRDPSGDQGVLLITYKAMSPGTPLEEVAWEMFEEPVETSEEIEIGPMTGRMIVKFSRSDGAHVFAFGRSEEGLAIGVAFVASDLSGEEVRAVRSVCESIEFKAWRERR